MSVRLHGGVLASGGQDRTVQLWSLGRADGLVEAGNEADGGRIATLTHGAAVSISGLHYQAVQYGVRKEDGLIDFDQVEALAAAHRPKLLFCGGTAYPRVVDFARFAEIGHAVGAIVVADIAHISGLVAAGVHPSPVPYVDVVTSTTHKSLRGPRGGMIMCKARYADAIDKAVFPGLQGGPHNGTTAAIAVALQEAQSEEFKAYAQQVVANSRALAGELTRLGYTLATGGTDKDTIE